MHTGVCVGWEGTIDHTNDCVLCSASIMKSPIPSTTSTATQPHHISLLHTINSPLVEALRLLATVLAAILALNTFLTSVILISITCTSLVVAMTAVAVLLFPPSPQPHNLGWLHTIPSLLSSVSNTAELVSSYSLAVISIVVIMGRDLLLALFFSVLCSLCRDILTDNDQY